MSVIPGLPANPKTLHELQRAIQKLAAISHVKTPSNPPLFQDGKYLELAIDALTGLGVNLDGALEAQTWTYTAGENISGDLVVCLINGKVYRASASTTLAGTVVGITRHGVLDGNPVKVMQEGFVVGLAGLCPGVQYFLGENGALLPTPAASGMVQYIGIGISPSILAFKLGVPIQRS